MNKKGAFSLIELLIVISIISILSLIAVQTFVNYKEKAVVSRVQSDLITCAGELMAQFANNGTLTKVCRVYDSSDTCTLVIDFSNASNSSAANSYIKIANSNCTFHVHGIKIVCDIDTAYGHVNGFIRCYQAH
ncbi:prepilin-type N-terminal cleavage/methylation domain-containing protein [Desulfurobacterium sp.]|uniref:prepilin-type N-terminal cleavage/methylation domain-containing protein n=1 Tax=Desulfurobacterium sp. TaxID=2004706 RepID=UPI00261F3E9C|nr:prepilin-type N-terminal cleavage/methylation domain-containing protein [Desulfurobacterium sp.]